MEKNEKGPDLSVELEKLRSEIRTLRSFDVQNQREIEGVREEIRHVRTQVDELLHWLLAIQNQSPEAVRLIEEHIEKLKEPTRNAVSRAAQIPLDTKNEPLPNFWDVYT